ncbi:MAG TPA: parallel beta-helix domain-containing protein, partial [Kofleriaceae bacterium]
SIFLFGTSVTLGLATGCGDNNGNSGLDCSKVTGTCMEVPAGADAMLQTAVNSLADNTTIILGSGTFQMTNQLTIRNKGIHLVGQGIDGDGATVLDFGSTTTQGNGVDVVGDGFLVQDLVVLDAAKDGIRVEDSDGVTFHHIRATWTNTSASTNGAYGIYPVHSKNVLVENSEAHNASDAGLYVGQCQHVIVHDNLVSGNVAGLEIENTEYADVFNNEATDNVGGIVVFDLPGNPIVGRDIRLRDNMIHDNNHTNFASGGTVASIPSGTGTFAMASRRVEITGNTYAKNGTGDIAIISGLTLDMDPAHWTLPTSTLVGDYTDLGLIVPAAGTIANFRSENILVAGNTHSGSGTDPDLGDPLHVGLLLAAVYGPSTPVDNVLYDSVQEPKFSATVAADNSNANHICVGGNTGGTFASLDLAEQSPAGFKPFFRPAKPFAPFDCVALDGGAVAQVTLPSTQPAALTTGN